MLRILGRHATACDGLSRRELLAVGGISLFGGLTLPNQKSHGPMVRLSMNGMHGPGSQEDA